MMSQRCAVHYRDGHSEDITHTQSELGQFDQWAIRKGIAAIRPGNALIQEAPVLWMRVGAFFATFRDQPGTPKPTFDVWDATVIEVEPLDTDRVDPTQTTTQDERSPD